MDGPIVLGEPEASHALAQVDVRLVSCTVRLVGDGGVGVGVRVAAHLAAGRGPGVRRFPGIELIGNLA
jgi:hypothetical protein